MILERKEPVRKLMRILVISILLMTGVFTAVNLDIVPVMAAEAGNSVPSAPKLTARAASSGVSAFVRIWSVRRASAQSMNVLKFPEIVAGTVFTAPS